MAERQPGTEPRTRNLRESCTSCSLNDLCLPVALDTAGIDALDGIVERRHALARREIVYRSGQRFHSVYAIRVGAMKSVTVTEDGEEQITAFHLPGELLGLDAIGFDAHPSTAAALETTRVCKIPFGELAPRHILDQPVGPIRPTRPCRHADSLAHVPARTRQLFRARAGDRQPALPPVRGLWLDKRRGALHRSGLRGGAASSDP